MPSLTKPKKKIVLQTQFNAFSPVQSYVKTGRTVTKEESFCYRNVSLASRNHARRMAGEGAKFLRVEAEMLGTGKISWNFVFSITSNELERI
jgi:hypothetical protein